MKAAGCCPTALFDQASATSRTNGTGNPPAANICTGSSTNLKSGNLYHSQDAGILTLSYNSLDPDNGPVGLKWTHNYSRTVIPGSDTTYLTLKTEDGNRITFQLSSNVYYPEAISGDTSWIVKNSNNTFTQTTTKGIIYSYDASGLLASIATGTERQRRFPTAGRISRPSSIRTGGRPRSPHPAT